MNSRTVSLPDLLSGKRKQTCMSLSEGFDGSTRPHAMATSMQNFAPKPLHQTGPSPSVARAAHALAQVVPLYYRSRQFANTFEKGGKCRVPRKLVADLRAQEQAMKTELRALHPLLFQRFDDNQLERLIRAMPFLRLSEGRWVFGGDAENVWPKDQGDSVCLLFSGVVGLFPDASGDGHKTEAYPGTIFGENHLRLCDEVVHVVRVGAVLPKAARCERSCMVGMISVATLETAYADRYFGNRRIAQLVRNVPSLARVCKPDEKPPAIDPREDNTLSPSSKRVSKLEADAASKESGAVMNGLTELSKVATVLSVYSGQDVMTEDGEKLEDSLLIVTRGALEIRSDVKLVERLDAIPPKRVRLHVYVHRAEKLAGDSIFDKLDPYCIVKLGDFKKFQTPVVENAGVNATWEYHGVLSFSGTEKTLDFTVNDHDKYSRDDLCGNGSIAVDQLTDGSQHRIPLFQPKKGIFTSEAALEVPAGAVFITVNWDYEMASALTVVPKQKPFDDQVLFTIKEQECWGAEQLMMGDNFKRTLESAANGQKYSFNLDKIRVVGASTRGVREVCTVLKVTRQRFMDFVKGLSREKAFMQACRVSSLEKVQTLKARGGLVPRLMKRLDQEEMSLKMRDPNWDKEPEIEQIDPTRFRNDYRGVKMRITVRNALNLTGGGWFDKLDPYAKIKFRGSSKAVFTTSVKEDAGSDPVWNDDGALTYNGETALEISVWDYDPPPNPDDLLATGVLQLEEFCGGYEGIVNLNPPGSDKKKKKNVNQMMVIIGIQWDPPRDPSITQRRSVD